MQIHTESYSVSKTARLTCHPIALEDVGGNCIQKTL